ncbi:hypothetical protein SKAU_G00180180 [Synaphobranchus kaupii]|uniref:Exportin-5 C-terminal domain-containing protein n=1 Tax=Synaphobranchus kaupii TaxID=118154 RepID=A0A9Q1FM26_SYNKA|nr:hypothetical protein SKAU_G00180180 [Synaphobranchus kaupii]
MLWDPVQFLAHVGADQNSIDPIAEDMTGINRSRISFCVYTILGVVKRARWPADVDEAAAGGFVVGQTAAGAPIYRNPCSAQVLALLPNLLALIRTHNNLFLPENMARLSDTFTRAYEVMDVEKNLVLGLPQPVLDIYDSPVYKTTLERMQGFFCTLYDNCFHILGKRWPLLAAGFLHHRGLGGEDRKLRPGQPGQRPGPPPAALAPYPSRHDLCSRVFIKQLVVSCPSEYYESLLCPLLGQLFTYMLQRLNQRWQFINQKGILCGSDDEEVCEEKQVTQEMLEEQLVRLVTREVMDLISVTCILKKAPEPAGNKEEVDEEEMMATDSSQAPQGTPTYPTDELTELGKCLLQREDIYMTLLTISFNSLSWRDTGNCHRMASLVCWALLRQVIGGNLLPEAVTWFYTSVLKGLQMHGQHEGCSAALMQLAFSIYETLRPRYSELRAVMTQIPNIQAEALNQYDQRILNPPTQKVGEKKKKDQFKRLLAGTVGKPLGQQFKKEVHIRNLPSLFKKGKPDAAKRDILESSEDTALTSLFTPPPQEDI